MALPSLGTLWALAKSVDRLFQLEEKQRKSILDLQTQLDALAARMVQLEAREEIVVVKAEAAARSAAMGSATAALADIARQVGALQERTRGIGVTDVKRLIE